MRWLSFVVFPYFNVRAVTALRDAAKREMIESMDKIAMLTEILMQDPKNAFARYGLAMEYAGRGETDTALSEFARLLADHPDYTAGYFMAAQTLAKAGRNEEAKIQLTGGIASARRTGNQHALSEMQGMLDELEIAG
jgi:predicted Zn-dependent protease